MKTDAESRLSAELARSQTSKGKSRVRSLISRNKTVEQVVWARRYSADALKHQVRPPRLSRSWVRIVKALRSQQKGIGVCLPRACIDALSLLAGVRAQMHSRATSSVRGNPPESCRCRGRGATASCRRCEYCPNAAGQCFCVLGGWAD